MAHKVKVVDHCVPSMQQVIFDCTNSNTLITFITCNMSQYLSKLQWQVALMLFCPIHECVNSISYWIHPHERSVWRIEKAIVEWEYSIQLM